MGCDNTNNGCSHAHHLKYMPTEDIQQDYNQRYPLDNVYNGAQLRALTERYGPLKIVYIKTRKGQSTGLFDKVLSTLTESADMEILSIDSTCIKIHQSYK